MRHPTPRSCGTHDGTFHADEVTACALLLIFDCIDRHQIIRTRDPAKLEQCDYVCDVGGIYDPSYHLFDHHQIDYEGPLSSAGMVLLYLQKIDKIDQSLYNHLEQTLIKGVDEHDNGKELLIPGLCTYSHVISNFNPIHYNASADEEGRAFNMALDFALGHLSRLHQRYSYIHSCRALVEEQMEQGDDYLSFEQNIPWLESFFELGGLDHPAKFVIMPSGNHWKLRGIPPTYQKRMQVRHPLPKLWAGLLDEELKRISGIPGAFFCHKGRFISVWASKEDALRAMEYTLHHTSEDDHDHGICQDYSRRATRHETL
jgi:uncharacterized UPF0160 family protein